MKIENLKILKILQSNIPLSIFKTLKTLKQIRKINNENAKTVIVHKYMYLY